MMLAEKSISGNFSFAACAIPVPGFALAYMQAIWEHEWLQEWIAAAEAEDWVIEQFEAPARV